MTLVALKDTTEYGMLRNGRPVKRRFQVAGLCYTNPESAEYARGVRQWKVGQNGKLMLPPLARTVQGPRIGFTDDDRIMARVKECHFGPETGGMPEVWVHNTDISNLHSILSEGLQPGMRQLDQLAWTDDNSQ